MRRLAPLTPQRKGGAKSIAVLRCVKYRAKNLTPNPFPTREGE